VRPSNLADSSARCGEGDCSWPLPTGRGRVLDVNPWRRVSGEILARAAPAGKPCHRIRATRLEAMTFRVVNRPVNAGLPAPCVRTREASDLLASRARWEGA
jgi:hypothetical protein